MTTLYDSFKETRNLIDSMITGEGVASLPRLSNNNSTRISRRLLHPPAIREKGTSDISHWHGLTTGLTPQRYVDKYYESANSSKLIVKRKRTCLGRPIILVDEEGKRKNKINCMRCGGRSNVVYCTICHHSYCMDINRKKTNDSNMFGSIDTGMNDASGKKIFKYGIISCYHHEHPVPLLPAEDCENESSLPHVTPRSNSSSR